MKVKVAFATVVVSVLIALPLFGACAPAPPAPAPVVKPKPELTISAEFDLTAAYAAEQRWIHKGWLQYLMWQNETEGGIKGCKINHVWGDFGMEVPRSISIYERAKGAKTLTHATLWVAGFEGVKGKIHVDEIPTICGSPGATAIMPDWKGYSWNVLPYYEDVAGGWVKWFLEKEWKKPGKPKLATIGIDNPFGRISLKPELVNWIKAQGVDVVAQEIIPVTPLDTTANLIKIRDAGADFIFAQAVGPTLGPLHRDMKKLGYVVPLAHPQPGGRWWAARIAGPEAAEGDICLGNFADFADPVWGVKLGKDMMTRFDGKVVEDELYFYGQHIAMVQVAAIKKAMEQVPPEELTGAKVKKFGYDRLERLDMGGVIDNVTTAKGWGRGQSSIRLYKFTGGKSIVYSDWFPCPDVFGYKAYYDKEVAPLYK